MNKSNTVIYLLRFLIVTQCIVNVNFQMVDVQLKCHATLAVCPLAQHLPYHMSRCLCSAKVPKWKT